MVNGSWFWPSSEDVNDFPDPVSFDEEWKLWPADLSDGPSSYAEIFVREYVQNSWDSIQASRKSRADQTAHVHDGLKFRFVELEGAELETFLANSGVGELPNRYQAMTDAEKNDVRLDRSDYVTSIEKPISLKLLICEESGGSGMWGHWRTGGSAELEGSRLRFALVQTKSNKLDKQSGGSWGHGKKAIAIASKCRSLLVYTCHATRGPTEDKAGVTRRLLGATYWRSHNSERREHVGLGLFGNEGDEGWQTFSPLENDVADQTAESLGADVLRVRRDEILSDRGTTYVIVEPSVDPAEIASAIERNWWPILEHQKLNMEVVDYNGEIVPIVPYSRPELRPFINAFRAANGLDGKDAHSKSIRHRSLPVGDLGVVFDVSETGFSYREDVADNRSLVALVRNDMVIAYESVPNNKTRQRPPFLRGVFVVDREKNAEASELLKLTEPHLHNVWRDKSQDVKKEAAQLAKDVLTEIRTEFRQIILQLTRSDANSSLVFQVFAEIFSGKEKAVRPVRPPRPPSVPRFYSIQEVSKSSVESHPTDPTKVRIRAVARVKLSSSGVERTQTLKLVHLPTSVNLSWKVLEEGDDSGIQDENLKSDSSQKLPKSFSVKKDKTLIGTVGNDELEFEWTSNYFPDEWQVMPFMELEEIVSPAVKGAS